MKPKPTLPSLELERRAFWAGVQAGIKWAQPSAKWKKLYTQVWGTQREALARINPTAPPLYHSIPSKFPTARSQYDGVDYEYKSRITCSGAECRGDAYPRHMNPEFWGWIEWD